MLPLFDLKQIFITGICSCIVFLCIKCKATTVEGEMGTEAVTDHKKNAVALDQLLMRQQLNSRLKDSELV